MTRSRKVSVRLETYGRDLAMNEASLERSLCQYSKKSGWITWKFTSPSQTGVPDRIFLGFGRVFFIEFKSPETGGVLSKMQEVIIGDLRNQGITVYVVDDLAEGKAIIDAETLRFARLPMEGSRLHL